MACVKVDCVTWPVVPTWLICVCIKQRFSLLAGVTARSDETLELKVEGAKGTIRLRMSLSNKFPPLPFVKETLLWRGVEHSVNLRQETHSNTNRETNNGYYSPKSRQGNDDSYNCIIALSINHWSHQSPLMRTSYSDQTTQRTKPVLELAPVHEAYKLSPYQEPVTAGLSLSPSACTYRS